MIANSTVYGSNDKILIKNNTPIGTLSYLSINGDTVLFGDSIEVEIGSYLTIQIEGTTEPYGEKTGHLVPNSAIPFTKMQTFAPPIATTIYMIAPNENVVMEDR